MSWLLIVGLMLFIFLGAEMRINDMQKTIKEMENSFQRILDKVSKLEKSMNSPGTQNPQNPTQVNPPQV